jgi:hypothetical protein
MNDESRSTTRKGSTPIKVYCLTDERAEIEAMARQTGNSTSSYLRLVGQGYCAPSILDYERVQELARINGDLGRLGGLLKLWLTDDAKLAAVYGTTNLTRLIVAALDDITANQASIRDVMAKVVTPLAAKRFSG